MRGTWVYRNGELIPKECAEPVIPRGPRSGLPAPMLIGDHMAPVRSMADGQIYDSKSALRAKYKEQGYLELGNDAPRSSSSTLAKPDAAMTVVEAYKKVRDGYKPEVEQDTTIQPFSEVVI